jgi:choline kinase
MSNVYIWVKDFGAEIKPGYSPKFVAIVVRSSGGDNCKLIGEAMMARQVVVLVAGRGNRLHPFTADRPKCLVEINGRSMLDRLLGQLRPLGVRRAVLVTGYRSERLARHIAENPPGMEVVLVENRQYETTENSMSLLCAREPLLAEDFLLCDGDVVMEDGSLAELMTISGSALLIEPKTAMGDEEMKVAIEGDRIVALSKRLDPRIAAGESIGIQKISAEHADDLWTELDDMKSEGRQSGYYEEAFQRLINRRKPFRPVYVKPGCAMEIDDVTDLELARRRFP